MPQSRALPAAWHETENIHLCTVLDFVDLCRAEGFGIGAAWALGGGRARRFDPARADLPNLRAQEAVFCVSARED
jgi:hypothetical protein